MAVVSFMGELHTQPTRFTCLLQQGGDGYVRKKRVRARRAPGRRSCRGRKGDIGRGRNPRTPSLAACAASVPQVSSAIISISSLDCDALLMRPSIRKALSLRGVLEKISFLEEQLCKTPYVI